MEDKVWTLDEKAEIIRKSYELRDAGLVEEARRLRKQVPLSPHLAKWGKEMVGPEFLIERGFNLSEAEAEYGKDWLTR
ncbi:hypothetical protein SAMD00024442_19_42 [Candidatus Symbiothrix dinenymphae]|nr:hypothetical protein SAMD00024442_19_42 [Candidatus Symbiothrix dinenymphae]